MHPSYAPLCNLEHISHAHLLCNLMHISYATLCNLMHISYASFFCFCIRSWKPTRHGRPPGSRRRRTSRRTRSVFSRTATSSVRISSASVWGVFASLQQMCACVRSVRISSTSVCVCVSVSVSVCAVCCLLRVCVCSHLFNKCVCVCGAFSDVSASVDHPALEGTDHRSREEAVRVLSVLMTFGRQPGVRATTTNGLEKLFGRSCATIRTPAKTVLQCPRGTFQTPDCRGTWGPHALFVGS